MRFDLETHDLDALFNKIVKQKRDQDEIEATDAKRRDIAKLRDAGSMILRRLDKVAHNC